MNIFIQYRDRGDIVLAWSAASQSEGRIFDAPPAGYANAEVEVPVALRGNHAVNLDAIIGQYRVLTAYGHITLVVK